MSTNGPCLKMDGDLLHALQGALERLDSAEGEMMLDFSAVQRIDPAALRALEELARKAGGRGVRVVLDGVNVDIYKVLKVTKLAPRFSFPT